MAIDQKDVADWKSRFNAALDTKAWNSASPPSAQEHKHGLFECFNPVDLCLISCCVPCITFGKTHHRTRKNANMEGYEPINTSCLAFVGASYLGLGWLLQALQLQDIRERYNLQGSCMGDIAKSCCCSCCAIIQAEKESEEREKMVGQVQEQYKGESMSMGGLGGK